MQFNKTIARLAAFAALVVVPYLSARADDSSGAHVFARHDNGTNIVSRLVPDGTDVAKRAVKAGFDAAKGPLPVNRFGIGNLERSDADAFFSWLEPPQPAPAA